MIWTIFLPVLNEAILIETKIKWALRHFQHIVIVEGSIPGAMKVSAEGLSTDGTSEILRKYSDQIVYIKGGKCKSRAELQNKALNFIHGHFPDTEILFYNDVDEFVSDRALSLIESNFLQKPIWLLYTDYLNLIDGTRARINVAPKGRPFPFMPGRALGSGTYHERFYRYRTDLQYTVSAHCLNDSLNRALYMHPDYYFQRDIDELPIIFHYKYVDDVKRLIAMNMGYLSEDEDYIPYSKEAFNEALRRVKLIFEGESIPIDENEHCKEVLESDWFKYEKDDFGIDKVTYDEVMAIL